MYKLNLKLYGAFFKILEPFDPAFPTKLNLVQSTNIWKIRIPDIPKLSRFHFTCHLPNDCYQNGGAAQQM